MSLRICVAFFSVSFFLLVNTPSGFSQGNEEFLRLDQLESVGAAHFVFAKKGQATIQLLVLGSVGSPGMYQVGVDLELDELLALSGGMEITNDSKVTVRLYRESSGRRNLIYEAKMDRLLAEPRLYPPLRDSDIIVVEAKERAKFTLQLGLSIITGISSVVLLVNSL